MKVHLVCSHGFEDTVEVRAPKHVEGLVFERVVSRGLNLPVITEDTVYRRIKKKFHGVPVFVEYAGPMGDD